MRIVSVNPDNPPAERLELALEVLRREQAVALPTETFYGLAVDCLSRAALQRVNAIKQKAADSPILLLMADAGQAKLVADPLPDVFGYLAERFWPGPLTLVVKARTDVPEEVSGGRGTVALRVPGLVLPRLLARKLGRPVSGPSANRNGEPPSRTAAEVARAFPEGGGEEGESEIAMLLDGGPTAGGAPSTVVDLTGEEPRLLREGLLPLTALRRFL